MKNYCLFFAILLGLLLPDIGVAHETLSGPPLGSVVIIVNGDNSEEISKKQVKAIFLGRRILWDSQKEAVAVILQPKETIASKAFNRYFFSDNGRRLTRQWIKNVVIGAAPAPITLKQDTGVVAEVRENKSAIGYVVINSSNSAKDLLGVRIVFVLPATEAN